MTTQISMRDWIKQVPTTLLEKDSSPLLGTPPQFPWEAFSSALAKLFEISNLTIQPVGPFSWHEGNQLGEGLGEPLSSLQITIAPDGGDAWWLMPQGDLTLLMSLLLTQQLQPLSGIDPLYQEAFYHFIAVEVLNTIPQLPFDKSFSGHLKSQVEFPQNPCLCIDVSMTLQEKVFYGRLALSPELQNKWKERYAERSLAGTLSAKLDHTLHLEAGHTLLTAKELSQIRLGDFILLDSCSLDANGEGEVNITLQNTPLFRGKIKEGHVKIVEYPLYSEANMANEDIDKEEEQEELDQDTAWEDNEEEEEAETEEGEEEEDEEEGYGDTSQEEWPPLPERRPRRETQTAQEVAPTTEIKKEKLSPEEIPLNVVVEIGRIQISIQKLMELQPGNLLELNIRPENGIDLVVNGKRIAKGELLLIGETLGVRILDIG